MHLKACTQYLKLFWGSYLIPPKQEDEPLQHAFPQGHCYWIIIVFHSSGYFISNKKPSFFLSNLKGKQGLVDGKIHHGITTRYPATSTRQLNNNCTCITCNPVGAEISTWATYSEWKTLDFTAQTLGLRSMILICVQVWNCRVQEIYFSTLTGQFFAKVRNLSKSYLRKIPLARICFSKNSAILLICCYGFTLFLHTK